MITVVLAEDSHTLRELLVTILGGDPEIAIVGVAKDGAEAVAMAVRKQPDVVAMDINMPVMDGLAATKELMVRSPRPIVLFTSSGSAPDVALALSATRAGALMILDKPDDPASESFERKSAQLIRMIKAMSAVKVVRRHRLEPVRHPLPPPVSRTPSSRIQVVAIAASTGGPAALQRILEELPGNLPVPVLVVQHIAQGFTKGLAEWLNASCALHVKIAEHGESLAPHLVYLPADDRHLMVRAPGLVEIAATAPVNGLRPSATRLFESVAGVYGSGVAAVILTGMGSDGVEGLRMVQAAGGLVMAQDEATSIVYGMPGEAVAAGVVHEVLPVQSIASRLVAHLGGANGWLADPDR